MPTVSMRYDIKSLIERYASIQVVGDALVHGVREFHSNCPWCPGSEDSFITCPETGRYSHAIRSSGCGRHGDGVDFLTEYVRMSKREAYEELALEHVSFYDNTPDKPARSGNELPPCKKWQEAGMLLVERAEHALWSPGGSVILDYLHNRGLTDETIKHFRYGYIPLRKDGSWFHEPFEAWGIDPEKLTLAQKEKGCVRVPPGILIPWIEGDILWRLAIKRPGEAKGRDYGQVMGSGEGLYNVSSVQYDEPCMMVESEFCAASVWQEARALINCVATGSTTRARTQRWLSELSLASCVLQSYDEDEPNEAGIQAGDVGADYWLGILKNSIRWSPALWKDPNDMLKAQLAGPTVCTLRVWVALGIEAARPDPVTPSPPLAREQEIIVPLPVPPVVPDYQHHITLQQHKDRLCTARVVTPFGDAELLDIVHCQILHRVRVSVFLLDATPLNKCVFAVFDAHELTAIDDEIAYDLSF